MTYTTEVQKRDRRAYVADYRRLDPGLEGSGLLVKVVLGRFTPSDGYDGYTQQPVTLVFSRPVSSNEAHDAAYDLFAKGCGCAHDCCGCWHGGASDLRPTTRRRNRNRLADQPYSFNRRKPQKPSRFWLGRLAYARNF